MKGHPPARRGERESKFLGAYIIRRSKFDHPLYFVIFSIGNARHDHLMERDEVSLAKRSRRDETGKQSGDSWWIFPLDLAIWHQLGLESARLTDGSRPHTACEVGGAPRTRHDTSHQGKAKSWGNTEHGRPVVQVGSGRGGFPARMTGLSWARPSFLACIPGEGSLVAPRPILSFRVTRAASDPVPRVVWVKVICHLWFVPNPPVTCLSDIEDHDQNSGNQLVGVRICTVDSTRRSHFAEAPESQGVLMMEIKKRAGSIGWTDTRQVGKDA
ncbi:hypothetical protein SODALDRAFT_355003 [Sodiomyces alkalinus F11]|uniref:Uncharacterized protein n=1 Tax=Sodiomyces alkalinus (strain CBS 110278 / VKM F-3762 / F11) TaxID=1314773 RepID=A0A3N2Q809_SODAK|nr:hypothetical protein SODALDRAFT_355003 [Sodiomyces alkalinus F11]ROT42817.1 hypothetical protein SODALDRAFT_355003 [Sodiomyces alkalinus F11]